jgi:hypothetical protein
VGIGPDSDTLLAMARVRANHDKHVHFLSLNGTFSSVDRRACQIPHGCI